MTYRADNIRVWRIDELFSLRRRVALVTGGARNLGKDEAEALAEAGADVAITSRNTAMANETATVIAGVTGRIVRAYHLDVTDETEVVEVIAKVIEDFGKLDILVNNAGNPRSTARPEERTLEEWNYTFAVNATGVFLCTREAAKHMIARKSGVIVNIASVAGMVGKDRGEYDGLEMTGCPVDYCAAKGAVINTTRDWACYLGPHGIRVNSISPGGIEDNAAPAEFWRRYAAKIPLGRAGLYGKDIKGPVVFLASEASSWVTGHNLALDGGFTAW